MSDNQSETSAGEASGESLQPNMAWPPTPADPGAAAEYKRLRKIQLAIAHKLERVEGQSINISIVSWAENLLDEIQLAVYSTKYALNF